MSEVQSRPAAPRGRGSARGGRGGFTSRGGRGGARGHATNGGKLDSTPTSIEEDEGEVGQLKKQYGSKVTMIKEMFPDWTDEDVVLALQETDGDLETTVDRITDGTLSRWGAVSSNKKDRSKSKAKEPATVSTYSDANGARVSRGGRAGFDGARGGRGRASDRGDRGGRGGRGRAPTNGVRKEKDAIETSTPTAESTAWETAPAGDSSWETPKETEESSDSKPAAQEGWASAATGAASATAAVAAQVTSSVIPDGVKKSWASIFAPAPTPKKAPEPVAEKPAEPEKVEEPVEIPAQEPEVSTPEPAAVEPVATTPIATPSASEPELTITPSKDELTEDNLEQVPDVSQPPPTATAASTAASSWDPRSAAHTPYSALQQGQPQAIRPPTSGFQASALKATGTGGRTASYQRRVLDQEEAVRMPGNRDVDRTAVQFGAFNLSGSGEEDVDGDREEAETRAQPPQHSPVAPRATLPPAPPAAVPESLPTPKQPAGLPAATHPTAAPGLPSPAPQSSAQATSQQGTAQYPYGRYGQTNSQESSLPQKPYDAFSQQAPSTQSPFDGYPSQSQSSQPPTQSGAFSSAPNEYSSYYTADPQQRNAYNSYYQQQYGQQGSQGQDGPASQQRAFSGYGGPQSENSSQFPQSAAQTSQSRYATAGEGQNSGHTTPNPVAQSQQANASQGSQPQPGHQQQPQVGNYPYGHPYYQSPYYAAWNQYQQYGGGSYPGGPYGAKGGHQQQPYQGYGMSPAAPYEHTASPGAGGFGASSLHGRESAVGGLSEYGRSGNAQAVPTPQALGGSAGAFGGQDAFGRQSSYQGQTQHYSSQQGSQPGAGDDLKPFGEPKSTNGPSPSLSHAGRPGSATNTTSALPPSQTQQGYGGYPAHLQQPGQGLHANQTGSQYGGAGYQSGGQGHQNNQYGGYQGFGGGYGNSQQQRGGWGGNYQH